MSESLIFLAVYICIPHIYAISLLTTLNARISLRKLSLETINIGSRNNALSNMRSIGDLQFAGSSPVFHVTESGTEDDIVSLLEYLRLSASHISMQESRSAIILKHPQI